MPARTGKAPEHRLRRRLFVEVHRLRIEFGGERQHLLPRDATRTESAEMAWRKIFEAECHGRGWLEGSLIVAVICGILNLPTHMAHASLAHRI
jgi:hypothetical protein